MNRRILFVDDDQNLLSAFQRSFRNHFEVTTVDNAVDGLELLQNSDAFALIVADYRMPKMNGIQFLTAAKKVAPNTVRIMLTGQADLRAAIDAVNEGSLFRFITKPCDPQELMNAILDGLEQFRLVNAERELLEKTLRGSVKVLNDILAAVNPDAFSHSSRVLDLANRIAKRLNIENAWEVELSVMLSHIGCVAMPNQILAKKFQDQKLTLEESEMYNQYPLIGRKLLENIPRLETVAEAIAYQNKNYNGGGFPRDNRTGENIPILSRILKVVLDFDFYLMQGKTEELALNGLKEHLYHYDPQVLEALEAEFLLEPQEKGVLELAVDEVQLGMTVAEDILAMNGALLVPKGQEVTEVLRSRLLNYMHMKYLVAPIKVFKPLVR